MEPRNTYVVLPRRSGKRLFILRLALSLAKEGKSVYVADFSDGDKIFEQLPNGQVSIKRVKQRNYKL